MNHLVGNKIMILVDSSENVSYIGKSVLGAVNSIDCARNSGQCADHQCYFSFY